METPVVDIHRALADMLSRRRDPSDFTPQEREFAVTRRVRIDAPVVIPTKVRFAEDGWEIVE